MKCVDCLGPVEEGYARCNRCMAIIGSMTYSEICAADDENYYARLGEVDEE
jgi:hypothetical protein